MPLLARRHPLPKKIPEFSTEDARYSVVRYFASNIENAYGPHVSDPRTGEILESHVGWYHNVMQLLRDWYFVQTAAANPDVRKPKFTDAQMGELISSYPHTRSGTRWAFRIISVPAMLTRLIPCGQNTLPILTVPPLP